MRTNLIICIVIALSMILCPVTALGGSEVEETAESEQTAAVIRDESAEYISVMSPSTGKITQMDMREYVIGSIAAEMSALYHTEALKAQAVASYTYAKRVREQNEKNEDSALGGADITDSPDTHQGYISEDERKEKWGDNFEEYEEKIEAAVDEVFGSYMTYKGETVLAVYHAISAGSTQSAESRWGSEIPYLVSVESQGDKLSPDYQRETTFTESEFKSCAKDCGVKLSGDAEEWVGEIETDESGYALSVTLGDEEMSASEFREAFELRSSCFEIDYSGGEFKIICKGYGHGVGMSQYGADYMARQGSTWQEILKHYYTGVEITE